MNTAHRIVRVMCVLLACPLIVLSGCDSAKKTSEPTPPDPVEGTTWTLDSLGGAFTVTTDDGTALEISVPADALRTTVTVEVTPITDSTWPRFTVEPAGTVLHRMATLTVRLPEGADIPDLLTLAFTGGDQPAFLPTTVDLAARTLQTEIRTLGYGSADKEGSVDQLEVVLADCEERFEAALAQLDAATEEDYAAPEVRPLLDQLAAIRLECDTAESEVVFAQTRDQACPRNADARIDAWNVPSNLTMDAVKAYVQPLVGTQALIHVTDAPCNPDTVTFEAVNNVLDAYADQLAAAVDSDEYVENTTWPAAWHQLRKALDLQANAFLVDQDAVAARISDELLPSILDQLRRAAYRECHENHFQDYLADILSGGYLRNHPLLDNEVEVPYFASFGDADIRQDMHLGASALTVAVYDGESPPQEIVSERRELGGGETAGGHVAEASITVPANGQIRLSGDIYAFLCPSNSGPFWAEQQLRIEFAEEEYVIREHGGDGLFFDIPGGFLIEMSDLLEQLYLDPGEGTVWPLDIWRIGTPCNELYDSLGPIEYQMFSISVYVVPAGETVIYEDVTVTTQDEVDALDGVTAVHGMLTVEGTSNKDGEAITDLSALGSLQAVESLTIKNTYATDLTGLANLSSSTHESGRLQEVRIDSNAYLQTLAAMADWPPMQELVLVNNHDLTDLTGLDNVTTIGQLLIHGADDLVSLQGLQSLEIVDGGSFSVADCPSLERVEHLAALHTVIGPSIAFGGNESLTRIELPALATVERQLRLDNNPVLSEIVLGSLEEIGGLIIYRNPMMTSMAGFEGVRAIQDDLVLTHMDGLVTLDGLQNLTVIGNRIRLADNPSLVTLAALASANIQRSISLQRNHALLTLDGLQGTGPQLDGSISINNNDSLINLNGAAGITSCANLAIDENDSLENLTGLGVQTVVNNLGIRDNDCLSNSHAEAYAAGIAVGGAVNVGRNGLDCN
jgi:hypothetical protein